MKSMYYILSKKKIRRGYQCLDNIFHDLQINFFVYYGVSPFNQ